MPEVTVNGLRFHTQTLGDPSDPPVVMIHGMLTGNAASWYFGLAPVVARRHGVFLYDQRGHGRSQRPPTGYTLTDLASDLDGLTQSLRPASVLGHSYGGVVALRHALDHPDRVTSLVLVDTFVPGSTGDADRQHHQVTSAAEVPDSSWGAVDPDGGARRRRPTAEQALLASTTLLSDLRQDSVLDPAGLAALQVPVLCAVGSDSPFRGDVEALVDLLPVQQRRVQVLTGGHALHLDAPDDLADLVTGFLDEVETSAERRRVALDG